MKLIICAILALGTGLAQQINLRKQVTNQLQPANAGLGVAPGTSIPATCSLGQVFVKTNSHAIYICTATNTWELATGSGTVSSVGWTGGIVSVATPTTTPAFTIAGNSGGVPYFNTASTWDSSPALALNQPLFGGGAGAAPFVGTVSGNTTQLATWSGAATASRCVHTDASGNLVIAAADCNSSTANMTITTGSGDPSGACTAGEEWYLDTAASPRRPWQCSVSGTWRLVVTSSGTGAFQITGPTQTTPSSPSAGSVTTWFDTAAQVGASKGSGGTIGYQVKNTTCSAGDFISDITAGTITCDTPAGGGGQTLSAGPGGYLWDGSNTGSSLAFTNLVPWVWPYKNAFASQTITKVTIQLPATDAGKHVAAGFYDHSKALICQSTTGNPSGAYLDLTFSPCTLTDPNPYFLLCTDSTTITVREIDSVASGYVASIANNVTAVIGSTSNHCTLGGGSITLPATLGTITGDNAAYRPLAYMVP